MNFDWSSLDGTNLSANKNFDDFSRKLMNGSTCMFVKK